MVEQSSSEWRIHCGPYLGEISALCFLPIPSRLSSLPFLLVGLGSEVLLYDLEHGKMMKDFTVFEGVRVHGITSSFVNCTQKNSHSNFECIFQIAVFGEKKVKLFSFSFVTTSDCKSESRAEMMLNHLLPNFGHWVLDVCFVKGEVTSSNEGSQFLVIGCSDNSVHIWDISKSYMVLKVQSPVRCLLYSMRLWGDNLEVLRIASGTIYNEIIVWKVSTQQDASSSRSVAGDHFHQSNLFSSCFHLVRQQYEAVQICKLVGHEGSIFRIAWSSCGSKLVSVSDDRSARVWAVPIDRGDFLGHDPAALVLFGHNARVWDCCILDSLIVTASEDCTCRIWGVNGEQLQMIKEHLGRGIWRCLYDPNSSLLITAGFDSAIKVHQPYASLSWGSAAEQQSPCRTEMFSISIPNALGHVGLMDSKSEYIRSLHFASEDSLYVATNHGYLYHAKLFAAGGAQWTQIVQVSNGAPIVCMDLLSKDSLEPGHGAEDWITLGDGKGRMTVIGVSNDGCAPTVILSYIWLAEKERQLLGTYWCKSLGCRYVFTADPRGTLKLWSLPDPSQSCLPSSTRSYDVSMIAEFLSSYGIRLMCLDACLENEVLVCGDLRGNMVLFPLLKSLLLGTSVTQVKIPPVACFKGVHGISTVCIVSVTMLNSNQTEIRSTGADGCICYLEYDRDMQNLQFTGMKQVKELSLIESVAEDKNSIGTLSSSYAAGFASVDFIIYNLNNETKVVKIPCGGWRRPHSYYLGDVPEMKNCFAYIKDEMINICRCWVNNRDGKIYPLSLHMQFHGREIHSLCFISDDMHDGNNYNKRAFVSRSSWIATGCEDGTVRLTWYSPGIGNWSLSKLLGEHVGGSAVRSICFVSKLHIIASDAVSFPDERDELNAVVEDKDNPTLLISVGAKRVLTSWLLKNRSLDNKDDTQAGQHFKSKGDGDPVLSSLSSSMTFQWLSTDMPAKYSSAHEYRRDDGKKVVGISEGGMGLIRDSHEDDWRYLAVTSFHVKCAGSRISVCFVVVACSDATLTLRALILPFRLWFDVAMLDPLSAPVLSLQHIIFPICCPSKENVLIGNIYIVLSGSTDGSIAFWDLTDGVESFMRRVSVLNIEKLFNCQKRPRTGRGSQGGRWWRSLGSSLTKKRQGSGLVPSKAKDEINNIDYSTDGTSSVLHDSKNSNIALSQAMHMDTVSLEPRVKIDDSSLEICEIQPLHVLPQIHQSGVNCLHVSEIRVDQSTDSCRMYNIISGGDDQALHHLMAKLSLKSILIDNEIRTPDTRNPTSESGYANGIHFQNQSKKYEITFLKNEKLPSAHTSAVKGVWTDGSWVFSTGLDQRVRCWQFQGSKLTEHAHVIVSVPEPEALNAKACGRNNYQIAVAGRGMQIVEFSASCE